MIKVYFTTSIHKELIATFESEETYQKCVKVLENYASQLGMELTESVDVGKASHIPANWNEEAR